MFTSKQIVNILIDYRNEYMMVHVSRVSAVINVLRNTAW